MGSQTFDKPTEYYKFLKQYMQDETNNGSKNKLALPKNYEALVKTADEGTIDCTLNALTAKFRPGFVVFSMILAMLYKHRTIEARSKAIKTVRDNAKQEGSEQQPHKRGIKTRESTAVKTNRVDHVPELFMQCQSNVAKAAVAMFCIHTSKEALRRKALFYILEGRCQSMSDVVALIRNRDIIRTYETPEADDIVYTILVQTFMELAHLTRDKLQSRFAMVINEKAYIAAVKGYIDKRTFSTIYPYDALVTGYLKTCTPPFTVAGEHETLQNQLKVDPKGTIMFILNQLPKDNDGSISFTPAKQQKKSSLRFDEETEYEVFDGESGFQYNLLFTNVVYQNTLYRIITYNDCLYDVVGSTIEHHNSHEGSVTRESTLYNNLKWSERLALLEYRAKIKLSTMTGRQLNDFKRNTTLAVSWMDKGLECCKIYQFKSDTKQTKITEATPTQ